MVRKCNKIKRNFTSNLEHIVESIQCSVYFEVYAVLDKYGENGDDTYTS